MPLSISPVPIQAQEEDNIDQKMERQMLFERSMKMWQFTIYRLGVRMVRTGYRLQAFVESRHAITN